MARVTFGWDMVKVVEGAGDQLPPKMEWTASLWIGVW